MIKRAKRDNITANIEFSGKSVWALRAHQTQNKRKKIIKMSLNTVKSFKFNERKKEKTAMWSISKIRCQCVNRRFRHYCDDIVIAYMWHVNDTISILIISTMGRISANWSTKIGFNLLLKIWYSVGLKILHQSMLSGECRVHLHYKLCELQIAWNCAPHKPNDIGLSTATSIEVFTFNE